jgi:hypothetical protein
VLEGGFIPVMVLWLSYFYNSRELPIRLSFFWTTLSVTTIFTSLLAYFLLRMRGIWGWAGWQWLFLLGKSCPSRVGLFTDLLMSHRGRGYLLYWGVLVLYDARIGRADENMVSPRRLVY